MNVDFDSAARDTDFLALDPEIFLTSMRTTVLGGLIAAKQALPHMLANGSGSIIFNSSIASLAGDVSQFSYGGAKAAVNWYVRAIAANRSEEHTSELQSLMRISYAVFCLKKKKEIK